MMSFTEQPWKHGRRGFEMRGRQGSVRVGKALVPMLAFVVAFSFGVPLAYAAPKIPVPDGSAIGWSNDTGDPDSDSGQGTVGGDTGDQGQQPGQGTDQGQGSDQGQDPQQPGQGAGDDQQQQLSGDGQQQQPSSGNQQQQPPADDNEQQQQGGNDNQQQQQQPSGGDTQQQQQQGGNDQQQQQQPSQPSSGTQQPSTTQPSGQTGQTGSAPVTVAPVSKPRTSLANAKVTGLKTVKYTGKALVQHPVVTVNGKKLREGTDYSIKCTSNVNPGKARVTITGKGAYKGTAIANFTVAKANNGAKVTTATKSVKAANLKKAAKAVSCLSVKGANGGVSYAKVAKGSSKALSVNAKTGKVTVKKGTKKGTYSIKVKVTAKGDAKHAAYSKTVTCKVKVTK